MDPWANGATAVVYAGTKAPAVWPSLIRDHGITLFAAVPGIYRQMLKYTDVTRRTIPSLRHGLSAGEALPRSVAEEWQTRTGTVLYEALGQSELSTYISAGPGFPPKPGAAGVPQPGRSVVILPYEGGCEPLPTGAPGLIGVHRSDPGLMLGYWRRPAEEAQVFRGEWFLGGDAGVMDEDGYVTHFGRRNDLMNAGGFRVSPLEVEEVLGAHPEVAEAATAEIRIEEGVSIIAAFIVPRRSAFAETATLDRFARERLAAYKRPKAYVFAEALPRTANGKLKRGELQRLFQYRSNMR
jgi:acyl-coenzyme A synthetase/AMP-(fatty) acid ligase